MSRKPKPFTVKAGQSFFVHRYKYRHDHRRRKCRRLLKKGKVEIVGSNSDGWYYSAKEEVTIL